MKDPENTSSGVFIVNFEYISNIDLIPDVYLGVSYLPCFFLSLHPALLTPNSLLRKYLRIFSISVSSHFFQIEKLDHWNWNIENWNMRSKMTECGRIHIPNFKAKEPNKFEDHMKWNGGNFHIVRLTLNVPCISASYIEIKIKINLYFHTFLWCLKRF